MWSLGCTLFELFYQMSPNFETSPKLNKSVNERILFPGNACFPLSAETSADKRVDISNVYQPNKYDQLVLIL